MSVCRYKSATFYTKKRIPFGQNEKEAVAEKEYRVHIHIVFNGLVESR